MDSPPAYRGQFYSTHLTLRCPNYKQCKRCKMCDNYNRHDPLCVACESAKPAGMHHQCRVEHIESIVMMEELYGRPFFDINAEPSDVTVDLATTSFNMENTVLMNKVMELEKRGSE